MKGRKPTPTHIKIVEGNPGKRKLPENEPKPAKLTRVPTAPKFLSEEAKKYWKSVAKPLQETGILTELDTTALSLLCVQYGRMVESLKEASEGDLIVVVNGQLMINPSFAMSDRAHDRVLKLLVEFGLTPSSRTRIQVKTGDEEKKKGPQSLRDESFAAQRE